MKILVYSLPRLGHLFPVVPTLLELKRRGHEVVVTTGDRVRDTMLGIGLRFRSASPAVGVEPPGQFSSVQQTARDADSTMFDARGGTAAADLAQALRAEMPDFLLVDGAVWGAMAMAEASELPWGALAHSPMFIPTCTPRALGPGLPPANGRMDRLYHWLLARTAVQAFDRGFLAPMNRLRSQLGLPALKHVFEHSLQAQLTLAYTSEPFEYPRTDWHPSVRFVGPGVWDAPAAVPVWLAQLDPDKPLILVCPTSRPDEDQRLAHCALDALASEPYQVVVTTPGGEFPHVPPNAIVARYAPHTLVFPRAACVLCHGGAGTTQKALARGIPVVVAPFGSDHFEVGRRVEVAQAGFCIPLRSLTTSRLSDAVRQIDMCRPGAERVRMTFADSGGAESAADAVLELTCPLSGSRPWMPVKRAC